MKKILFNSLIAISFFSSISQSKAQCTFNPVGTTSVSAFSSLSDMAIAPNNKIYTIAYNANISNIELKSAFTASSSWTLNATITTTTSVKPVIKIRNDGKIYVFIHDGIANLGKVYSSTGGVFTQVGLNVSTGSVSDLSIAFDASGVEYIAFSDGANTNRSTIKKMSAGDWINVGTTGVASSSSAYCNSLVLDNTDNPVVAFRDFANGYNISVKKLSGSSWVAVTGSGVVSTNQGTNAVLKVGSNGNFYLGYTETTDVAIIQTFNGSAWTPLGSPVSALLSSANSFDFDLDPVDVPYFIAIPNTSYYPTAYKYVAGAWTTVATGTLNNSNNNTNPTIDIDKMGTPYYSYVDISSPSNNLYVKTLASPISISTQPLSTQQICNGSAGSFSIATSGGIPTSYQWQNMASGTFTNAGAPYINPTTSSLSFTATPGINQNKIRCVVNIGCKNIISNTSTLTVLNNPTVNLTTTNPSCFGTCNGMITANPIGGTGPYTFSWSPTVGSSATLPSLCAGTYSVLVKDANNCSVSANANLITPSPISGSISGNLNICNGSSTSLTVTAAGGTPSYIYSWSPGASLNTTTTTVVIATPTATQIYTVTVTDINGCVNTTTTTVTVNSLPPVSAGADNAICPGGSAMNMATGANTYTWNPGSFVGANQSVFPVSNTIYTVTGTNTLTGCSSTDTKMVIVYPNPTVTAVSNPSAICVGFTATLSTSGALTYTWNPGALTGTAVAVTPTASTIYSVTGTATTGCTNTKTLSLIVNSNPTITANSNPSAICVGSMATLTAIGSGGTAGYTFSWTPGASLSATTGSMVTANPSSTQIYTASITDSKGCINSTSVSVTVNPLPIITPGSSSTICAGGTANISATGTAHTYTWNPGNLVGSAQIVSPFSTTSYTVIGTNTLTGCQASAMLTITVNSLPIANAGPTRTLTCANTSTTLAGSGGTTYSWTGPGIVSGSLTASPTINQPGTYSLIVTTAGCSSSVSTVAISQNTTAPSPTATSGTLTCSATTVALTGNPAGMTYLWSGPGITGSTTTQNTTANAAGVYTLTVTSPVNGCTALAMTAVTQNTTAPSPTASTSGILTCSTPTVALTGNPAGLTYLWSGPGISGSTNTQNTTANTVGIYTLMVTSPVNGCMASATTAVTQNTTAPSVAGSVSNTLSCIVATVNAIATTTSTPVSYSWSGTGITAGNGTATITVNQGGIFNYTVTNTSNGCNTIGSQSVSQNTSTPSPTATNSGTLTCTTTTVALSGAPGTGVTYLWSGPSFTATSQNAVVGSPGTYTLKVTNTVNGCTNTAVTNVTQNISAPVTTASTSGTITCTTSTVNLNSSLAGMNYTWTAPGGGSVSSSNTQNTTGSGAGTYSITVIDPSNGCIYSTTTSVSQNTTSPTGVSAGSNQTLTCSSASVSLNGSVSSPTNATVNWAGGVCGSPTNLNTTACSAGIYTLTASDPINGCTATSTAQVFVDSGVPIVSTSVTNSLTCSATNATVVATTTLTTVMYSWSGPGIISGASTANATVNQTGTYSVTVTNTINGCSSINNVFVPQDVTIPTISVTASPSVICSGNSTTLTASVSPSVDFIWYPGTLNGAIQNVSPVSTTIYTVVATNTVNGCAYSETTSVIVNPNPTVSITGVTNICKGSTSDLTASGATSYTWDSGANTTSISITPTITTTYTVTGEDVNGCSNSTTTIVSIVSSKSISGTITSTTGATTGDVILYKYTATLSRWDSIGVSSFTGSYSFSNIDSALYVVRAIPTATNIQITYGTSSTSWQDATVINHGCTNNSNQDITLIPFNSFTPGPGVLTGTVTEASGFGQRLGNQFRPMAPGQPIGGIIVKGGRNPGGQMLVQTETDAAGQYTLSGLPLNSGDEYFIFVDIPGLDTNGTYHIVIASDDTQIDGLNFTVDSIYINPLGSVTAISQEESILDNKILMFPNPAKQYVSIKYELIQSANVQIELYDLIGNKVKDISSLSHQEKNKYNHSINLENLSSGIYFVKLKINNSENIMKLIINE